MAELTLFVEASAEAVAARAESLVVQALQRRGATLTLAGGSTPRALYRRLAGAPIDWSTVTVLFGDERVVPRGDPVSNAAMAAEALLDHVAPRAVHRIETERGAEEAAQRYGDLVETMALDLVLLGMGRDGHTASLFPGGAEGRASVVITESPTAPPTRVSLSRPTLERADTILVLVTGADKAARFAAVWPEVTGPAEEAQAPAARVRPRRRWWWVVDEAAAAELPAAARAQGDP